MFEGSGVTKRSGRWYVGGTDRADLLEGDKRGRQMLEGGDGNDILRAGVGDDELYGDRGHDWMDGNDGNDRLYGEGDDDVIDGGRGDDVLVGGDGQDRLYAFGGDDILDGGSGWDRLEGHDGDDRIDGGHGDDVLLGGAGTDTLIGGLGQDSFVFLGDGHDTITDFAIGDKIVFEKRASCFPVEPGTFESLVIRQDGDNTVVSYGAHGDTITLLNFSADSLCANQFEFLDGPYASLIC